MKRSLMITAALCLGMAVTGCDNSYKSPQAAPPPAPPPPPPAAAFEESFGAGFADAFRRGGFDEPRALAPGDIIPVSFTDDPLEIPAGG